MMLHRKILSVLPVLQPGSGCDSPLSGNITFFIHGNVVLQERCI